jgi:hypothetical protein
VRQPAVPEQLVQLTALALGRSEERTEWTRREERVTGSPEPVGGATRIDERPEEARLADARLAGYEQQLPGAVVADVLERLLEELELAAALDEGRGGSG